MSEKIVLELTQEEFNMVYLHHIYFLHKMKKMKVRDEFKFNVLRNIELALSIKQKFEEILVMLDEPWEVE